MTQDPNEPYDDIWPRDQMEHYKIELARLRTENERLTDEVDYLRQALAAALSKVPRLEGPASATSPAVSEPVETATSPAESPSSAQDRGRSWEQIAPFLPYARYLPVASFMGLPLLLLILLALSLTCIFIQVGAYLFLAP